MNRFNILKGVAPISIDMEPVPAIEKEITPIISRNETEEEPTGLTIVQPTNFYCPQCGMHSQNSVNIHFNNDNLSLNGHYCMSCLALWINRNIPRLISE
jgi:hypothetical protein